MRLTVNTAGKSTLFKALLIVSISTLFISSIGAAQAANKTITCYKGTVVKKVTAAKPKCPTGYSTTKPKITAKPTVTPKVTVTPKPTVSATPTVTATTKPTSETLAFNGTYTGKIGLLWGDSYVQVTSVDASGTGTILGLSDMQGVGSAAPASQCDSFGGSGTISGGGNTLKLTFDTNAQACAEDSDAPTGISITGSAIINGGTGKYAGASGTLKVTGSFNIKTTAAGKTESDAFKITMSGNIKTK
jgi:hypothetical protein